MSFLRGLLLDNLGLKLVALLLALVVYLHVFTERPATMVIAFPLQIADLADTLALSGGVPATVEAELEGTGKQFIRLWLTEPSLKISLAGVGPGKLRRIITEGDLPLIASDHLTVRRLIGPDTLDLRIERKVAREVTVAPRLELRPRAASRLPRRPAEPRSVTPRGVDPRPNKERSGLENRSARRGKMTGWEATPEMAG